MSAFVSVVTFPNPRPDQCPVEVRQLQNELLVRAESVLGPKSKKIHQPTFSERGPHLINTPSLDGAFATLSMNAAGYWPTTVFELAHETVHLLDPVVGYTNFLEEGIAVAFSVAASRAMTNHPMEPMNFPVYLEAWSLVREAFGNDLFAAGKEIRVRCGALRRASVEDLVDLFPSEDPECLRRLVAECIPR